MQKNNSDEKEKRIRTEYVDERKLQAGFLQEAYKSFEYSLLFLSFSSIVLAINYAQKINLNISCLFRTMLSLWAICLILQLFSRFICTQEIYKEIELLNEAHAKETEDLGKNIYKKWSNVCNFLALILYLLGLFLFLFYVV